MSSNSIATFYQDSRLGVLLTEILFVAYVLFCDLNLEIAATVVMAVTMLIALPVQMRMSLSLISTLSVMVACLALLIATSIAMNDMHDRTVWNGAKDVFFLLKIPVLLLFASILSRSLTAYHVVHLYVRYGVAVAVVFALSLPFYLVLGWLDTSSIDAFGRSTPFITYATAIAAGIMLLHRDGFPKWQLWLLVAVNVISLERRLWLVMLCAVAVGWLMKFTMKQRVNSFILVMAVATAAALLLEADHNYSPAGAINEIYNQSFDDHHAINKQWRAYELFVGINTLTEGALGNWLVGFGPGYMQDLGLAIRLGGSEMTNIPIFHNGYLYLLLKTGVIGALLFLLAMSYFGWNGKREDEMLILRRFILLSFMTTTLVAAGIFGHADSNVMLLLIYLLWITGREGAVKLAG